MPNELQSVAWSRVAAIHEAIAHSDNASDLRFSLQHHESWGAWYLRLLTVIDTLAARQPLHYLTSSLRKKDGVGGSVLAFTEKLVITAKVSEIDVKTGAGEVRARTWGRNKLELISATPSFAITPPGTADEFRQPDFQQFELRYPEETVLIPMMERGNSAAYDGVESLYASLVEDLNR